MGKAELLEKLSNPYVCQDTKGKASKDKIHLRANLRLIYLW